MLVPPALLCKGVISGHFATLHPAYLVYRISLPGPAAFRGVTSSPLRTAFSIGVASSITNVKPNNSALPLSVDTSVALAIYVLDMGFDGRGGTREGERKEVKLGVVRLLGGVDGRGCGLRILGGDIILVDFDGRVTGRRTGGGERMPTGAAVVAFSSFAGAASTALWRGGSIWRSGRPGTGLSKGTTGPNCVLVRFFGLGGSEGASR